MNTRIVAGLVAGALAFAGPMHVIAAPAQFDAEMRAGQALRETAPADAADRFEAALRHTNEPRDHELRHTVIVHLVDARWSAYDRTGDVAQLRRALGVLTTYLDELDRAYGDVTPLEARDDARALRVRVEEELSRVDVVTTIDREVQTAPTATPARALDRASDDTARRPPGRAMLASGGVLLGVGVIALVAMSAGLAAGARAEHDGEQAVRDPGTVEDDPRLAGIAERGRRANGVAIAGGLVAVAAVAAGATLVAIGVKRRRSAIAVGPGPTLVGAAVRVAF
jgi:hypothetical protein